MLIAERRVLGRGCVLDHAVRGVDGPDPHRRCVAVDLALVVGLALAIGLGDLAASRALAASLAVTLHAPWQ